MSKKDFFRYLEIDEKKKKNTVDAYVNDINSFEIFIKERGINSLNQVTKTEVVAFFMELREAKKSKSTINRKMASLRAYYKYEISKGNISYNPTDDIKTPKAEKKELEYLTLEEVERLLELPDDSLIGLRDRAMLEVLYGTGIRVTELTQLKLKDVNLKMNFISCTGEYGKARIIPLGSYAKKALVEYIEKSRPSFLPKGYRRVEGTLDDFPLFLNYRGMTMTRQGFWKILKAYGEKANIADRISPNLLRNTFAVHLLQNGADFKTLQELMGFEDVQSLQPYMSIIKCRIKDVYNKTHPRA